MNVRDRLRHLARLNRSGPEPDGGGEIRGRALDDDSVPYRLSDGFAIVHGDTLGVEHDGPVVVQGDDWAPLARDDRPEWMTEASYDRIAGQRRPRCYAPAPGFSVGFGHPGACLLHPGRQPRREASRHERSRMVNPLNALRDWWLRPVLDRLDEIARNTRPAPVAVEPMPWDQGAFVESEMDRIAVRELRRTRDGRRTWA